MSKKRRSSTDHVRPDVVARLEAGGGAGPAQTSGQRQRRAHVDAVRDASVDGRKRYADLLRRLGR